MSSQQLKRVALGLVVVIFLWGASHIVTRGGDEPESDIVFPALDAVDVDSIIISRPADTLILARTGTAWTVNGRDASADAISQMFNALNAASPAPLMATRDALHARMGVDSASAKRLRFVHGERSLGTFLFGNRGSLFNSVFVRRSGEAEVYQYTGSLSRLVDQGIDDWRNKQVVDLEADSIGSVVVSRRRGGYTVTRADSGWTVGASPADSAAVERLLGQYGPLTATGFPTDAQLDSANFDRPDLTVTVLGLTGDTLAALAFDSSAAAYWLRRGSDGTVFRVLQWKVNQLAPADSTLR